MNGNLLVANAAQVVTCSGFAAKRGAEMSELGVIENGAVWIRDGKIAAVGTGASVRETIAAEEVSDAPPVLDAAGCAVLPGFIDAHTHFVFGGYRADEFCNRAAGMPYMEILKQGGGILNTVRATRATSKEALIAGGQKRLDSMLAFGVTTVEGKSGYGLDRDTEIRQLEAMREIDQTHPIDVVPTFLGAHAVLPEYKGTEDAFIDFLIREVLPEVSEKKLAAFCDVFCEDHVFTVAQSRKILEAAAALGLKPKLHADEMTPLGGADLAAELGAVSADHLLQATDTGIRKMAAAGVVANFLPATAFSLKEPYARARFMIDAGCAAALSTDLNPGSCFTHSIPLLFALAVLYMDMTPEEAVTAVTINAAAALDRADSAGSIDVGKAGDLVVLEYPSYRFLPYHIGVNIVDTVVKNGIPVYSAAERKQ